MLWHNLSTYQTKVGATPRSRAAGEKCECNVINRLLSATSHTQTRSRRAVLRHTITQRYIRGISSGPAIEPSAAQDAFALGRPPTPSHVNTPTPPSFAIFAAATLIHVEFALSYHVCDQVGTKPCHAEGGCGRRSTPMPFGQPVELSLTPSPGRHCHFDRK